MALGVEVELDGVAFVQASFAESGGRKFRRSEVGVPFPEHRTRIGSGPEGETVHFTIDAKRRVESNCARSRNCSVGTRFGATQTLYICKGSFGEDEVYIDHRHDKTEAEDGASDAPSSPRRNAVG